MRPTLSASPPRVLFARKDVCTSLLHLLKNEQGHIEEGGVLILLAVIGAGIGAGSGSWVMRTASLGWILRRVVRATLGGVIGGVLFSVIAIGTDAQIRLSVPLAEGIVYGGVTGGIIGVMSAIMTFVDKAVWALVSPPGRHDDASQSGPGTDTQGG